VDKKIVLIGAGSAAFGPPTLIDLFQSKVLPGSTVVLHDINEEKLNRVYDIVVKENKMVGEKYNIIKTLDRKTAIKNADFIVCSIENGDRFEHRWEDHTIPHKHGSTEMMAENGGPGGFFHSGSTEMMAENGGPGGFFHSARQIPEHIRIAQEVYRENPHAFFIIYSNPVSRISLAVSRAVPDLKFLGLCHQINLLYKDLPYIVDDSFRDTIKVSSLKIMDLHKKSLQNTKVTVGGLNHFAFVLGLEDLRTGEDLMPKFNERLMEYYTKDKWDKFHFAELTFEIYKRMGWFPYVGDNHLAEYLQVAKDHTKYEDFDEWIKKMEDSNIGINDKLKRFHRRLEKGRYPRKGIFIEDSNVYETAVNIPNDGIIENLPHDLVIECSGVVNKEGVHGVKLGKIPVNIAAILRIEASIQDVCVEAILKESKDLAIACIDVNCGSFEMADRIYNEMYALQKDFLPKFY
jgi:alpha-galactosidase